MLKLNKILFEIVGNLNEEISAREAYSDGNAIQTVIDGKRDVCWISWSPIAQSKIEKPENHLSYLDVPYNPANQIIVYRNDIDGAEERAKELLKIAKKYGGYLAWDATEEDSRRIGELLSYKKEDIDAYINRTGDYKP